MSFVAGQESDNRGGARRRRGGAAIAVSLAAHVILFVIVGFNAPKLIAPSLAPLAVTNVWLMPRLIRNAHKPAEHNASSQAAALPSTPKAVPTPAAKPLPAPAAPRTSSAAAAPVASGPARGSAAPAAAGNGEDGVQEALRTSVGCDFDKTVHLTRAERERCNQHYGEMARTAPALSGIDPLKRGRFDDQAAADERRRADRTGTIKDGFVPCTGEGSNFGLGCLPDSAIAHVHSH